jgi:hypothetical protein
MQWERDCSDDKFQHNRNDFIHLHCFQDRKQNTSNKNNLQQSTTENTI